MNFTQSGQKTLSDAVTVLNRAIKASQPFSEAAYRYYTYPDATSDEVLQPLSAGEFNVYVYLSADGCYARLKVHTKNVSKNAIRVRDGIPIGYELD
jgi:hypothetical protein